MIILTIKNMSFEFEVLNESCNSYYDLDATRLLTLHINDIFII